MGALTRVLALLAVACAAALWTQSASAGPVPWCGGSERVAANRLPDLQLSPNQIRVVYAIPSDGKDNFETDAPLIVSDVASIDAWWRGQDPTRAPRWDLYPFPGCPAGFGQLDLAFVRLPSPGSAYLDTNARTVTLASQLLDTTNDEKKTLVYYDGPVSESDICGTSGVEPTSGGTFGFTFVWLGACDNDLGTAGEVAHTATHELLHDLGAEPDSGPPHGCPPPNTGHPCDSSSDILYPFVSPGAKLSDAILDVGRDDYYGHSGSWWDVQDSSWLQHLPQFPLTIATAGTAGSVRSGSTTVSCGASCTLGVDNGAAVQLDAVPQAGSRFVGWRGACAGRGACSTTMDAAKSVTAVFAPAAYPLTVVVRGRGVVLGGSRPCASRCTTTLQGSTKAHLRARPAEGYRFVGWAGDCHGTGTCTIAADRAHRVLATFARRR
jgi:hypothetical protein